MENIVKKALERFKEVLESLDCECDSYNNFVCSIHSDKILVENALKSID